MNDIDVRKTVHAKILKKYHEDPNVLVVDELSINLGLSRIDIAVVNGLLHGFELKSFNDNLNRLPLQVEHYSSVMDKVTLVVDVLHCTKALSMIPSWWGVKTVERGVRGSVKIKNLRSAKLNKNIDPLCLAKLLWKNECLDLLAKCGHTKGTKSLPRFKLWDLIAEIAPLSVIQTEVRHYLKTRISWRD